VFSLISAFCVLLKSWEIWNEARFQVEWRHRRNSPRQRTLPILRLTTISVRSSLTAVSRWGQHKRLMLQPDVASLTLSHYGRWTTLLRAPFMKYLDCRFLMVNHRPFSWAKPGVRTVPNWTHLFLFPPTDVKIEWVALMLCIWEVPGSDLDSEAVYSDSCFVPLLYGHADRCVPVSYAAQS
jgi:hypothetical protein